MTKISLHDFEIELSQSETIKKLNQALIAYLLGFGINTFSFTYYSYYPASINKIKYDFCSDNYKVWHKHYLAEGYEDIDSTLKAVYNTILPITWNVKDQFAKANNQREKRMREDSIRYGVEKGISFPIHGPKEDFAILMLAQRRGQNCLKHINTDQYEWFSAAHYYYHYLKQHLFKTQFAERNHHLSNREMECLALLARQYSTKAIAKELNITERTVHFHIQRLNNKIGTKNKYQSLFWAFQKGIIKL